MAEQGSFNLQLSVTPGSLVSNLKNIQVTVDEKMAEYATIEATEDNLIDVKKTLANLRKLKSAMKDNRKGANKEYNNLKLVLLSVVVFNFKIWYMVRIMQ